MAENPSRFLYITRTSFQQLLVDLNVDSSESGGLDSRQQNELLDQATGDLEADLVQRYIVPLQATSGAYSAAPGFSQRKVLNAIKSKIRQILGGDKQKNIVLESTERYVDLKKADYNGHIKALVDHKRDFGFRLQSFAADTAVQPVQSVGTARPSSERSTELLEGEEILFR